MRARWSARAIGATALILALGPASAATALAPVTGTARTNAIPGRYVVVMKRMASAASTRRTMSEARAKGAIVTREYELSLKGFAASLEPAALSVVRSDPNVAYLEADAMVAASTTQAAPSWGLDRIDQTGLPLSGTYDFTPTGAGVTVYVIDTGVRLTHEDFGGRATSGIDVIDGGPADDCNGHGTHVAGTIGGATFGIAKSVSLVAVRVLGCSGSSPLSGVIAGIEWVTGDHRAGQRAAANMSLGGGASAALDQAVESSIADGITYVVAAGNNNGDACAVSPARVASALTVGATTSSDARAGFSNFGSCVDLFAPGDGIRSDWNNQDDGTNTLSGTSMAAPHVTGVVATYLQVSPLTPPATVGEVITYNASGGMIANVGDGSQNRLLFSRLGSQVAFQANSGDLWTTGWTGRENTALGMRAGTSPSIAALSGGGHQTAFQANTGDLWTAGTAGTRNLALGMMAGTSPSITALSTGGYQIAFQANDGMLWTAGSAGTGSFGLRMMTGTSPSIARLSGGGYQIAYQADTSALWTTGAEGTQGFNLGMMTGTSPSITALSEGRYQIAFQANSTVLWTAGAAGTGSLGLGMMARTSPSITTLPSGRYQIAFQANNGELWTAGAGGLHNQGLGMRADTSPSVTGI